MTVVMVMTSDGGDDECNFWAPLLSIYLSITYLLIQFYFIYFFFFFFFNHSFISIFTYL